MSKNRKNFHYHYAEQYETRAERIARRRKIARRSMPPIAVIVSLVLLVMFGLISTTFSVVVSSSEDAVRSGGGSLVARAQNHAVWREMQSAAKANQNNTSYQSDSYAENTANDEATAPAAEADDAAPVIKRGVLELAETGAVSSSGTDKILWFDVGGLSWWQNDSCKQYLSTSSTASNTDDIQGTKYGNTNVYYFVLPAGSYTTVYEYRGGSAGSSYNMTSAITLSNSLTGNSNNCYYGLNDTNSTYSFNSTPSNYEIGFRGNVQGWGKTVPFDTFSSTSFSKTFEYTANSDTTLEFKSYNGNVGGGSYYGDSNGNNVTVGVTNGITYDITVSLNTSTFVTTVTAVQKTWPVTVNAGNNGSVSSSSVITGSAGARIIAYPNSGYRFVNWTTTDSSTVSFYDANAADTTVYATGAGSVTANFEEINYCNVQASPPGFTDDSKLNLGDIGTVTVSARHHTSGDITVTSGDSTKVLVSNAENGDYAGTATLSGVTTSGTATLYVKGIAPTGDTPVTLTVACGAGHESSTSATVTVEVSTPGVSVNNISDVTLDSSGSFSATLSNPTNPSPARGTVSYAIVSGNSISLSGTNNATYTANQPGTTTVRATYAYSHNSVSYSATCDFTVTVANPVLTLNALSVEEYKTATLSVNTATPAPSSLTWSRTGGANVTLGTGTTSGVPVTAPAYDSSSTTATIQVVATYAHYQATFNFSGGDAPITVTESPVGFNYNDTSHWQKMVYDPTASSSLSGNDVYKCTMTLAQATTYYLNFWNGTSHYNAGNVSDVSVTETLDLSSSGLALTAWENNARWPALVSGHSGTYTIYLDNTDHKMFVIYPPDDYYLFGSFYTVSENNTTRWGISNDYKFTYDSVNNKYTLTIDTNAANSRFVRDSTYSFKISKNGDYSNDNNVFTHSNYQFNSGTNTINLTHITENGGIGFYVRANGVYTFTFTPGATPTLKVEYPEDEYYLWGSFNEWDDDDENYKFTKSGSSYVLNYTVTDDTAFKKGQLSSLKISVNGNNSKEAYYTATDTVSSTTTVTLNRNTESSGIQFYVGAKGDYTFTFDPTTPSLQISYPADVYYLVGTFNMDSENHWLATDAYKFTLDSTDNKLKVNFTISDSSQIKKGVDYEMKIVKNGNFTLSNHVYSVTNLSDINQRITGSVGLVTPIGMTANSSYNDIPITMGAKGNYTVTFYPSTPSFSIAYPDDTYYLIGTFNKDSSNNWLATDAFEFKESSTAGIWRCTVNTSSVSNFALQQSYNIKVSKNGNFTKDSHLYGYETSGLSVEDTTTTPISLTTNAASQEIQFVMGAAGEYKFTLDLTGSNPTLKIEYPGREYFLLGFGSGYWSTASPVRLMTTNGNGNLTYTLSTSGSTVDYISKKETYSGSDNGFCVYCNDGTYYSSNTGITSAAPSLQSMTSNTSKPTPVSITTTYSGSYVFSFNPTTTALSVIYPTRSVSLSTDTTMSSVPFNSTVAESHIEVTDSGNDDFTFELDTNSEHNPYYVINSWKILLGDVDITANPTAHGVEIKSGSVASGSLVTELFAITVTTQDAVVVQAVLQPIQYTVTIHTDEAVYDNYSTDGWAQPDPSVYTYTKSYYYGESVALPGASDLTQSNPWHYDGWYTSNAYSGDKVTSVAAGTAVNKEFWLRWTVHVTFMDNVRKQSVYETDIRHGTTPTLPADSYFPDNIEGFERTSSWYNNTELNQDTIVYRVFRPLAKEFNLSLTAYDSERGDGSESDPFVFKVKFGAVVAGTATITAPESTYGTVYKWSLIDPNGIYSLGNSNTTYSNSNMVDSGSSISYASRNTVVLYSKAYYDDGLGGQTSISATAKYFCYYIDSPLNGLEFSPVQKIYSTNSNTATGIRVLFQEDPTSILNIATATVGATDTKMYKASLVYFDTSTLTFRPLNNSSTGSELNDITVGSGTNGFESVFGSAYIGNELNETGVKYYDAKFWRYDEEAVTPGYEEDSQWGTPIHTTVGTVSTSASQPLFVVNQISAHPFYTEVNGENIFKRVMAFYVNGQGGLGYQTARPFIRDGKTDEEVYRFDIPTDVTEVVIGVFDPDEKYVLPTLSSSGGVYTITFRTDSSNKKYFVYHTNWINLEETVDDITYVRHVVKLTEFGEGSIITTSTLADTLS